MYEYKFVAVDNTALLDPEKREVDYHQVVDDHAQEGWRLVQVLTLTVGSEFLVEPGYCELIFEKAKT